MILLSFIDMQKYELFSLPPNNFNNFLSKNNKLTPFNDNPTYSANREPNANRTACGGILFKIKIKIEQNDKSQCAK